MATAVETPRTSVSQRYDALTAEDFETASIHSAAPSYISEAPSYHSQILPNEPAPPYTPREGGANRARRNPATLLPSRISGPAFMPPVAGSGLAESIVTAPRATGAAPAVSPTPRPAEPERTGLPPIPPLRTPMSGGMPNLAEFRIPTLQANNPSARHYVRVAQRRAQRDAAAADAGFAVRMLLEQVEEEESRRFRPLEDPYLVGEEEAQRARQRRIAREQFGDEALERESRRWDWFLNQVRDWDERDRRANSPAGQGLFSERTRKHRGRLGLFGRR